MTWCSQLSQIEEDRCEMKPREPLSLKIDAKGIFMLDETMLYKTVVGQSKQYAVDCWLFTSNQLVDLCIRV